MIKMTQEQVERRAAERMTTSRRTMLNKQPFYGVLAMQMDLVPDWTCPTMATDYESIFYNPQYVCDLEPWSVETGVAHECTHVALLHNTRRGRRDPKLWNIAGDYSDNDLLLLSGFRLDRNDLHDLRYRGWTTEAIYDDLVKQHREQPDRPLPKCCEGLRPPKKKKGAGQKQQQGQGQQHQAMSLHDLDPDKKAMTKVYKAAMAAKMAGKLPHHLEVMVSRLLYPQHNWLSLLKHWMRERMPSDYSWRRPNRRYTSFGLYLPMIADGHDMGELVVVMDTSMSIQDNDFKAFFGGLHEVCEQLKPKKVHVVCCDTKIQRVDEYTLEGGYNFENFKVKGRGGTSFVPPFEWIEKQRINPVGLIYFTDLEGTFPKASAIDTLWVLRGKPATDHIRERVPFGMVTSMQA